jgi:hypothetical protein
MTEAVLVRVTTEIQVGDGRATALWIVATPDRDEAVRAVTERVSSGCIVEATESEVKPETVKRLGLARGQAWHL